MASLKVMDDDHLCNPKYLEKKKMQSFFMLERKEDKVGEWREASGPNHP